MVAKSLIQQRIALDRARIIALLMTFGGVLLLLASGASIAWSSTGIAFFQWWVLVGWCVFTAVGAVRLVRVRRRRSEFEAEHGRDAGKQRPL